MSANIETACCFTGHRLVPQEVKQTLSERLRNGVDYLYSNMGVKAFYTGGALGFDTLAAEAVIDCRKVRPDIRLIIVMPCADQAARWHLADKIKYERLKRAADEVICLSEQYHDGCMQERNRYLVDHSVVCICYLTKPTGGTAYTVKYAKGKGLRIFNLAKAKGASA